MAVMLEARVTNLEQMMAELITTVRETSAKVDQTTENVNRLSQEMAEFKEEMRQARKQSERELREWRIELGNISNKMGTMVEDLVAPSIPRIFREVFNIPDGTIVNSAIRVRREHTTERGKAREFDAVAFTDEYLFINETKSSLTSEKITKFVETVLPEVRAFMPEHADKRIVGAVSSLFIDESVVRYGERQGLIVLGTGEDLMDVLNSSEFSPKFF